MYNRNYGVQKWHLGDSETSLASKRGFNEQVLEASPSTSFSLRLLALGRNPINLRDVPSMEFLPSVPDSTFNPCSSLKKCAHTHTHIEERVFQFLQLVGRVPDSVIHIGFLGISGCSSLERLP